MINGSSRNSHNSMIKSRIIFVASAVFLSAALATNLSLSEPDTKPAIKVKATEVLTWDCELPEYKPEAITLTCADGGLYVDKIQWDSWSQKGATGTGTFYEKSLRTQLFRGRASQRKGEYQTFRTHPT